MCGWVPLSTNVSVEHETDGPGWLMPRYGGLVTCGSIWACPVCSGNIRHQRGREVSHAALEHLKAGGSLVMLTLTVPHSAGMPLHETWGVISEAWHACASGRRRKIDRERWGLTGYVKAVEVTHGGNGWHPHLHVLLFLGPSDDLEQLAAEVEAEWFERWHAFVTGRGWRAPSRANGVDARAVTSSTVGEYLVKVQDGEPPTGSETRRWTPAMEITRSDLKRSYEGNVTPFGLVNRWMENGDRPALAAWREYEVGSKGRKAITWSRGLKKLYGVDTVDDQSAADRREWEAEVLYLLCPEEWHAVRYSDADTDLLLHVAQGGGREAVESFLRDLLGLDELSCSDCQHDLQGLRTHPCDRCGARLRAVTAKGR